MFHFPIPPAGIFNAASATSSTTPAWHGRSGHGTHDHEAGDDAEHAMHGVGGKITTVNGASFTVQPPVFKRPSDTATTTPALMTVTTNSATVIKKDGKAATLADITADSYVMVRGTVDATAHTVAATNVDVMTTLPARRHADMHKHGPHGEEKGSFMNRVKNWLKK